jgi:bifunctional ADP-heptose synthase (sugar kinase/adenylyltransferase)
MTQPTIAVFGDSFTDVYHIGETTRISPEAPVPVVKISEEREFPGGCDNVIANLRSLGAVVVGRGSIYTSFKNRLCVGNYQLARWDVKDSQPELDLREIKDTKADAVIISDYGKGSITYAVIEAIAALTLPTFIDTKRDPRDFDVVQNPTFFPNQKEYEQYVNGYCLQPRVVLKRGAEGIQYHEFGRVLIDYPAWASKVVSVCGAGDTVIASFCYATVKNFQDPLGFANRAAALVVEKPWTATCTIAEMNERFGFLAFPVMKPTV